jgi:hypothetical protein
MKGRSESRPYLHLLGLRVHANYDRAAANCWRDWKTTVRQTGEADLRSAMMASPLLLTHLRREVIDQTRSSSRYCRESSAGLMKLALPRNAFVQFASVLDVIFKFTRRARVISQSRRKFQAKHA